jgi:phosphopantothenoylcysteine decarboxylase
MSLLAGKEIVLGVTGGVAAYKAAALCSKLAQAEAKVTVTMTQSAMAFIGPPTFTALSGRPVVTQIFDSAYPLGPHIELARRADLLVVAPCTANFLAAAAAGRADDLLTTLYLAFQGPSLFAPAMNVEMWEHPAVQRNAAQVQADGVTLVGPEQGWLSCRTVGSGRMSEPEQILDAIQAVLAG